MQIIEVNTNKTAGALQIAYLCIKHLIVCTLSAFPQRITWKCGEVFFSFFLFFFHVFFFTQHSSDIALSVDTSNPKH